jgi:hypothetical protein
MCRNIAVETFLALLDLSGIAMTHRVKRSKQVRM